MWVPLGLTAVIPAKIISLNMLALLLMPSPDRLLNRFLRFFWIWSTWSDAIFMQHSLFHSITGCVEQFHHLAAGSSVIAAGPASNTYTGVRVRVYYRKALCNCWQIYNYQSSICLRATLTWILPLMLLCLLIELHKIVVFCQSIWMWTMTGTLRPLPGLI